MAGNPVCGPGLRSDERERKSAVFSATGGRMLFATGLEGGVLHNGLRISLSYRCGYPQSDFAVLADGQPRDIAVFEAENTPLDLAVVLDLSGIQQTLRVVGRPDPVRLGLIRMLDDLSPQDRLAVVSFSSRPHQVSGLTSDHASLRDALKDAMNERLRVREPSRRRS